MRAALVVLVVLVGCLGCDVDGLSMMASDDGGAQAPDATLMAPDTAPAAPTPDAGMKADRSPAPDTRAPDTMPVQNYPECSASAGSTETGCGFLVTGKCGGYGWVPKFKNGFECAVCTSPQRTGCLEGDRGPDECGNPKPTALCVQGCAECCYRRVDAPCESDADCCSPLRCQSAASGSGKACK